MKQKELKNKKIHKEILCIIVNYYYIKFLVMAHYFFIFFFFICSDFRPLAANFLPKYPINIWPIF